MHLTLPDDWEMLQYSKNPVQGRCAFADRYQFRFEMNWSDVQSPPDMERLLSDYAASIEEARQPKPSPLQSGAWHGLSMMTENGCCVTGYCRYFSEISQLLEICFIYPSGQPRDGSAEDKILSSVHPVITQADACQPWRAFGLDWCVSPELSLSRCTVSCGLAELSFCSQNLRATQTFSRRGLLSLWLKEPMEQWIKKTIPKDFTVISAKQRQHHGHDICDLLCAPSSFAWTDLLFGKRLLAVSAFLCPQEGRLYAVTDLHRGKKTHPTAPRLSCSCGISVSPGGAQ